MNDHGLDDLLRSLTESRRAVLGGTIAAGSSWLGVAGGAAKKKRRKKTCAKKPCPECPVPATCPEACSSSCGVCVTRVGAPPLCGATATKTCATACASDNDCAGTDDPYCASQFFRFSTGQTADLCSTPGGFCTNVFPCFEPI
jgi:hypothetical protein